VHVTLTTSWFQTRGERGDEEMALESLSDPERDTPPRQGEHRLMQREASQNRAVVNLI